MIDLHCHLLPGIDDGPETMEESLALAQSAVDQGITHVLCTPHHNNGRYENPKASIIAAVAELQIALDETQIPLTVLEGQEVRMTGELIEDLNEDNLLFTDLNDTYLLIEFPSADVPAFSETLLFELRGMGKIPVIVHPERNRFFMEDPDRLIPFLEMGCLAQLTAPSIVGIFGKKIQKIAHEMVERNLVQMVASDAHGVNKRPFSLREAYEEIERKYGNQTVQLMKQVTKDLVNGDEVEYPPYVEKKKKKFGLF